MSEIIATTQMKREKEFIYFMGTDANGNLTVCRAKKGGVKGRKHKPNTIKSIVKFMEEQKLKKQQKKEKDVTITTEQKEETENE